MMQTTIKTTYRIDRLKTSDTRSKEGVWGVVWGYDDAEEAERVYDEYRNTYQNSTFRLVRITEHCSRHGKGKVYL